MWVPLRLHDEHAIGGWDVKAVLVSRVLLRRDVFLPKSTSAGRHQQHRCVLVLAEIVQDPLPCVQRGAAVDAFEWDSVGVEVPLDQVEGSCPAGENDTSPSQLVSCAGVWIYLLLDVRSCATSPTSAAIFVDKPSFRK